MPTIYCQALNINENSRSAVIKISNSNSFRMFYALHEKTLLYSICKGGQKNINSISHALSGKDLFICYTEKDVLLFHRHDRATFEVNIDFL